MCAIVVVMCRYFCCMPFFSVVFNLQRKIVCRGKIRNQKKSFRNLSRKIFFENANKFLPFSRLLSVSNFRRKKNVTQSTNLVFIIFLLLFILFCFESRFLALPFWFCFSSRKINVNVQLSDPNELKTQTRMKAYVHTPALYVVLRVARSIFRQICSRHRSST